MPLGNLYPRFVSVLGSDKQKSGLGVFGVLTTCGTLSFSTTGGDFWIYLDGTNPVTPMWGGFTEVMTNPGGGVALGTAVAVTPTELDRVEGITVLGAGRVSGAAVIVGPKPALGLMRNNTNDIVYLFALPNGDLRMGSEANWLAGAGGTLLATIAPSGFGDTRREGASLLKGNTRPDTYNGLVLASSGVRGAGLLLASGDHRAVVAMSADTATTLKFEQATAWLAAA